LCYSHSSNQLAICCNFFIYCLLVYQRGFRHARLWINKVKVNVLLPRELRQYSNRKLFSSLAGMMVVTFIATAATVFTITTLLSYRQGAQDHNDTRVQVEILIADLGSAETGQRGYLLTGDPAYLAPYTSAAARIPTELEAVKTSTKGWESQQVDLSNLSPLVTQKLAELNQTVGLRQSGNIDGAMAIVQTGKGQALMEQIRSIGQQLQVAEASQLSRDEQTFSYLSALARDISIISMLATIVLSIMVYWIYLKAIQNERRLDQAKDEFVALASHQLRTPATGIKSILATLVAEDFGPLNERQAYFMRRALESNERELAIIEELLNVAKADAGRLTMHRTEFNLDDLVDSIVAEQSGAILKKNQDLKVNRPSRPVLVVADEEKIYMAIGNLLDNARKYTPDQGKISISISGKHGAAQVEVTDTGVGIATDDIDHIFDRFARAGEAMQGNVDGTGLGLYLAGRIAQLHGGTIDVTSKLGKGTKFVMILPQGDRNAAEGAHR
jgi:signal transduction histidine kinase